MNEELNDLFKFYLPDLDQAFAKAGIELSSRPVRAASFIVEKFVIEVEGDSIENYHQKPWFGLFFNCARQWYEGRYGDNLNSEVLNKLEAAVQIYQRWYLLEIPVQFKKLVPEEKSAWVYFPTTVREGEDVLQWIQSGPNFEKMNSSTKDKVLGKIEELVALVRKINLNLWVPFDEQSHADTAEHIKQYIASAAKHFADNKPQSVEMAIWEMHFAFEQSFKLWLSQKGLGSYTTHDLTELNDETASLLGHPLVQESTLEKLPSGTDAINFRYAKLPAPSLERQHNIYRIGLQCIKTVTDHLERELHVFDAGILLKQPPWHRYGA